MNIITRFFVFLFVCVCFCSSNCFSQNLSYDISKGEYKRKDSERIYIVGKVVNIAADLQHRAGGAYTQDALFSKGRQGLKTSGDYILTFVDNIKGQDLQWNKDYLGKFVKIFGWVFHDAQYVEVDSFSVGDKDYIWDSTKNAFSPA